MKLSKYGMHHSKEMSKEQIGQKICYFKNSFDLLFLLMNTLLQITYDGWFYCYCVDTGKCLMCRIPQIFYGFEKMYEENMFHEKFSYLEHEKLYGYLIQVFEKKKNCIDCFIHSEYTYRGCDWNCGKTWSVGLQEQLEYNRKIKLDQKKMVSGSFN